MMSNTGYTIPYDPVIANRFGVIAALIIGLVHFRAGAVDTGLDGIRWVRLSLSNMAEWINRSTNTIGAATETLVKAGVLQRKQLSGACRAYSYAIDYDMLATECPDSRIAAEASKCRTIPPSKNRGMDAPNNGTWKPQKPGRGSASNLRLEAPKIEDSNIKEIKQYKEGKNKLAALKRRAMQAGEQGVKHKRER